MKPNFLNNAFTPAQARAIEKYVESVLNTPASIPAPVLAQEAPKSKQSAKVAPVVAEAPVLEKEAE